MSHYVTFLHTENKVLGAPVLFHPFVSTALHLHYSTGRTRAFITQTHSNAAASYNDISLFVQFPSSEQLHFWLVGQQ